MRDDRCERCGSSRIETACFCLVFGILIGMAVAIFTLIGVDLLG